MLSFIAALLIGRATGGWRYMRAGLLLILIACVIAGFTYAAIIFNAVLTSPKEHHVQHYSTH
jgi:hypothetical protein